MSDQPDAFNLLSEEMQTDEVHLKVNAIHRLKIVILSMGQASTVSTLIPYLDKLLVEEEDEVLFAISEQLGKCWSLITDKTTFLPLLESLAKQDETVVREQATRSLTIISEQLSDAEIQNVFTPLVIRLAQSEWFTGRVSSVVLFQHAYQRANVQKERLRRKFIELCQDDTPMIRRACAKQIGEFASQLKKDDERNELLKIFKTLFTDEQDAIRVLCLESLIPLAKTMSKDDNLVHNMPTLLSAGADKSWKVRLCFARNFAEFTEAFGKDITDSHLIQNFSALLSDNEPEVKNAAIHSLSKSIGHLSLDRICNLLLPTLSNQYSESQPAFKASTALALCAISTRVGTDMTMTKILPILRELLQDDNSDVRLNVAKNLIKVADTVGPDLLSHNLIEILKNLSEDANWRVRMAVYETLGKLSVLFGEEVYMKHLEPVFMTYLKNSAAQVRVTGITESAFLAEKFGRKWINDSYVQKVVKVYEEDRVKYNFRMTAIKSLASVMPHMASEDITKSVVPVFIKACNDKVPNVQFCVARTIRECKGYIDDEVFAVQIEPKLRDLANPDNDADVWYHATLALSAEGSGNKDDF